MAHLWRQFLSPTSTGRATIRWQRNLHRTASVEQLVRFRQHVPESVGGRGQVSGIYYKFGLRSEPLAFPVMRGGEKGIVDPLPCFVLLFRNRFLLLINFIIKPLKNVAFLRRTEGF